MLKIADRLVAVREKNGYTRKRLAEELGRPYRTITNYEMGEREPGHEYIVTIAKKFHVTTDYLLGISDEESRDIVKAPLYSSEAQQLARDYDELDEHGRRMVRMVITEEKARCTAQRLSPASTEPPKEAKGIDIETEVADYYRELLLEKEAAERLSASTESAANVEKLA